MTPAEKYAKELVYWYENLLEPFIKDKGLLKSKAKQCALICQQEKIDLMHSLRWHIELDYVETFLKELKELEEAKQAINKL